MKSLTVCFLLVFSFLEADHPLKMSVCDVKYHPDKGHLTLKFKFFWDDLEAYLEKQTGRQLTITQRSSENDQVLSAFIHRNFTLKINQMPILPRLYTTSVQDVVLVVESIGQGFQPAASYEVEVTDRLLLDAFSDQYNLVRFDFWNNGNLETMRFEKTEEYLRRKIAQ
ncbi:MAG: hypothetical protein JNJ57_09380 [Saprospiraceae bacterium]|nr:hypothetical protein [Saprospiraceae bacterium]